jgi:hypothetical protein
MTMNFHCPRVLEQLIKGVRKALESPAQLKEHANAPLFSSFEPKQAFLDFLRRVSLSRPTTDHGPRLSKAEYRVMLRFIDSTEIAFWDLRSSELVYGKPADQVKMADAFKAVQLALSASIARILDDASATHLSPVGSAILHTSKYLLGGVYISLIGTVLYGLAAGAGSPVSDFIIARGKRLAFYVSNILYPPSHEGVPPGTKLSPDWDLAKVQTEAVEHYRLFMSTYSLTEQLSLGRATWYETSLLMIDNRLEDYRKAKDRQGMEALFVLLADWERRFVDLQVTELGVPAKTLLDHIYETYDPDGSLRKRAKEVLNAPGSVLPALK